jgi:hypothetical protein
VNVDQESPVELFKGTINLPSTLYDCDQQLSVIHSTLSMLSGYSLNLSGFSNDVVLPTSLPTSLPSVVVSSTTIVFDTSFQISNVSVASFAADISAQTAARNATASSMSGVALDQVVISDFVSVSSVRRLLAADAVDLKITAISRKLADNGVLEITFVVTVVTEQFGLTAADATTLYASLTAELNASIVSGDFTLYLDVAAVSLGATSLN